MDKKNSKSSCFSDNAPAMDFRDCPVIMTERSNRSTTGTQRRLKIITSPMDINQHHASPYHGNGVLPPGNFCDIGTGDSWLLSYDVGNTPLQTGAIRQHGYYDQDFIASPSELSSPSNGRFKNFLLTLSAKSPDGETPRLLLNITRPLVKYRAVRSNSHVKSPLESLPMELMELIFGNLGKNALASVRLVSRQLACSSSAYMMSSPSLSSRTDLKKFMDLCRESCHESFFCHIKCLDFTKLKGYSAIIDDGVLFDIAANDPLCQSLHDINLSGCEGISSSAVSLLISKCLNLKNLYLNGCSQITDLAFRHPRHPKFRLKLPELQNLEVLDCPLLTDDSLLSISQAISSNFQVFKISRCKKVSGMGVLQVMKASQNVSCLEIAHCGSVSDSHLMNWIPYIHKSLVSITLQCNYGNISRNLMENFISSCLLLRTVKVILPLVWSSNVNGWRRRFLFSEEDKCGNGFLLYGVQVFQSHGSNSV